MFFASSKQIAVPCKSQLSSEQHDALRAQHDSLLQTATVKFKAAMQILIGRQVQDQTDEATIYDYAHTAMT